VSRAVPLETAVSKAAHYLARLRSVGHVRALSLLGYRGSRDVQLDAGVRIPRPAGVSLGDKVHLCRDVKLESAALEGSAEFGRITLGDHVFVGDRTSIVSFAEITIGRLTMLAHNCSLMDFNHGTTPGEPLARQQGRTAPVVIGSDCWLGAGVIVLPGVTVGDGTVVGAGSVVTGDLPAGVIAAGVPARVLRPR
jgi:acetyltransferase-like isoleucine patch superfamily enzyme